MKCNVCGKPESIVVACSACGPVSFSYCAECAAAGCEPYGTVMASLFGMSSMDDVAEWYRPTILATLKGEGKTEEELFADVRRSDQEYLQAMEKNR